MPGLKIRARDLGKRLAPGRVDENKLRIDDACTGAFLRSADKLSPRRAIIVEDSPVFQVALSDAIARLDGWWTVNSFSLGRDAIAFAQSCLLPPEVVLIDLGLPDIDGAVVVRVMRQLFPDVPILIISVITNENRFIDALRSGANGYILKDDEALDIATSVDQVLKGRSPISPLLARCLIRMVPQDDGESLVRLSTREQELVEHIAAGKSYMEAASAMGLKISSVHAYSRTLFRKLGARSQIQAVAKARRRGLVSP